MPLIPWSAIDRATGRIAATEAAAALVNPVLDAYCEFMPPINDFFQDAQNFLVPGLGDTLDLPRRVVDSFLCPNNPPLPAGAAPGVWAEGCSSFGRSAGYYRAPDNPDGSPGLFLEGEQVWDCSMNVGLPIGAPFFANASPAGAAWGWFITCRRADGSTHVRELGVNTSFPQRDRYVLTDVSFTPCPGCNVPIILPPRPVRPTRPTPPSFPIAPQIPINIQLPQLPGLPPITIPVVYAPITPTIDINAPITLAPNLNFDPTFNFAPRIELNLGGISITGGGYPEPIPDVEEIVNEGGGDCPDPCPELDYERITEIVFDELDNKFPPARPFTDKVILLAAAESRTFVLPEFTQWVELTVVTPPPNRRSQFGGAAGETVYYNGWYSFGVTGSTSERFPIHYDFMSIPIPKGVEAFTYTIYVGGTASGRIGYLESTSL